MKKINNKRMSISLISFNTMGAFSFDSIHGFLISRNFIMRQRKIAEILKTEDPDIITLQEVHSYFILKLLKAKLNYPYVAYKKFIYGPRGGLVTFSKLPLEDIEYINFKKRGTFFNSSFIARVIKNGILMCRIKDLPLVVLNTHATPNLDHDHSIGNRFVKYIKAQLDQIVNIVNKLSNDNKNIIVAGDFNVAKDSHPYKNFLGSSGLKDVFYKTDSPTQHQEFLPKSKSVKRIDYIFLKNNNGSAKVTSNNQLFTDKYELENGKKLFLSDHLGLRTTIDFQF